MWRESTAGRRVLSALLTVGGATVAVKAIGAAKVILIARYYGAGDQLDAYLAAFLIPAFFADAASDSAGAALIPAYVAVRERQGEPAAARLLRSVLFLCLCGGLVLLLLLTAFSRPLVQLVASGFPEPKLHLTEGLYFLLIPIFCFGALSAIWRAVLNVHGRFALPALIYALTPASIISAILIADGSGGAWTLAWGTLAGSALEAAFVGWELHRRGISPLPRWSGLHPETKRIFTQYGPLSMAALLLGASAYCNQAMGAMLEAGSVSALSYGNQLLNVLLAIGPTALGIAVLPHFSEFAARGDWPGILDAARRYGRLIWLIALPATFLLILASPLLIRIFFERGQFSTSDTRTVAQVQQLLLIQIPAMIHAVMIGRVFSAFQAGDRLLAAAALKLTANIGLNLLLMPRMGVEGIALSSSIAGYLYCGYLIWALRAIAPMTSLR